MSESLESQREELFDLHADKKEEHDLASVPSARPTLERMRVALNKKTAGALLPERFSPWRRPGRCDR